MLAKHDLLKLARAIRSETRVGANTAERLGALLEEMVYGLLHHSEGRGYIVVSYFYELNLNHPDMSSGATALVLKATSSSAGWASWDDVSKTWRMMEVGYIATTTTTTTTPTPLPPAVDEVAITTIKGVGIKSITASKTYKIGTPVFLNCAVSDGYTFDGWYAGVTKVHIDQYYSFTAVYSLQLEARASITEADTATTTTSTTTTSTTTTSTTPRPAKVDIRYLCADNDCGLGPMYYCVDDGMDVSLAQYEMATLYIPAGTKIRLKINPADANILGGWFINGEVYSSSTSMDWVVPAYGDYTIEVAGTAHVTTTTTTTTTKP